MLTLVGNNHNFNSVLNRLQSFNSLVLQEGADSNLKVSIQMLTASLCVAASLPSKQNHSLNQHGRVWPCCTEPLNCTLLHPLVRPYVSMHSCVSVFINGGGGLKGVWTGSTIQRDQL